MATAIIGLNALIAKNKVTEFLIRTRVFTEDMFQGWKFQKKLKIRKPTSGEKGRFSQYNV